MKKINLRNVESQRIAYGIIFLVGVLIFSLFFFRNAVKDENLYMHETVIISELLQQGKWIGNYATGLHGFLYKLPVALVFMLTGPSVAVATLFNLFLALASGYIFYRILRRYFKFNGWALAGLLLFIMGFEFVRTSPTYLRDIPVLFTFLLFLDQVLKKKSRWLIGLILVLLLDAKEHVFFMITPAYGLWVLIDNFKVEKLTLIQKVLNTGIDYIKLFFPPIFYLLLMIFTGVIPVNMFDLSILGLIDKGLKWNQRQFSVSMATANLVAEEGSKEIYQIPVSSSVISPIESIKDFIYNSYIYLLGSLNVVIAYLGKVLYPRSFSFISIPKVVILPAVIMSVVKFKPWWNSWKTNREKILLILIMWSYLVIFILRASHGRYLLALTPIVIIFFIYFLRDGMKKVKMAKNIVIVTSLYVIFGLYYEVSFVGGKTFVNILLILSLFALIYVNDKKRELIQLGSLAFVILLGLITTGTSLLFSVTQGQISEYLRWGANHEVEKVVSEFNDSDTVIFNDIGWDRLPSVYRKDLSIDPEWKWDIKSDLPKSELVRIIDIPNTIIASYRSVEELRINIEQNSVEKVGIVESQIEKYPFSMQQLLAEMQNTPWLILDSKKELKNATLYIFSVVKPQ